MEIVSIIVGGLAGSAMALEYADLAPCGQTCINNMFEQACSMNCPPYPDGRPNLECLCKDANFFNGIHDCAFGACLTQDAENTVGLAAMYCMDPTYNSLTCTCSDPNPLLQPDASPAAVVAPDPEVSSNSDPNPGSGSPADNDNSSNPSDSRNSNSDGGATPNGNNNNNNNNANDSNDPRVDTLTYLSNENTFIATVTATPATNDNDDGVVSSNSAEGGEGGGLRTVTAYVAPKSTGLGNTAAAAAVGDGASKTNKVNASTPTLGNSGTAEKDSSAVREMASWQWRVLLAFAFGLVMVI